MSLLRATSVTAASAVLVLLSSVVLPVIAAASMATGAETRIRLNHSRTSNLCPGCELDYDELASDSLLAARGCPLDQKPGTGNA